MKRTAFVTGGTGFLGSLLIQELVKAGWNVHLLHRKTSDLSTFEELEGIHFCEGDVTDKDSLLRHIPEHTDAVFHLAASTDLWKKKNRQQNLINIEGTRNVVETCLLKGIKKLIHTSTHSVYGMPEGRIVENSEKKGKDSWVNYHSSKYRAEQEVLKGVDKGLDAVILNPCSMLGAQDANNWGRFIRMAYQQELPGIPPGGVSFGHGLEVVKAHIAAVDKGRRGENYLLGGTDATFLEVAAMVEKLTGKKVPKKATPAFLMHFMAGLQTFVADFTGKKPKLTPETVAMLSRKLYSDSSKAIKELDYQIVPLEVMVKENLDWQKEVGLIG